jgi:pyridoxal 5'-phosphate synthase pdxT subunit
LKENITIGVLGIQGDIEENLAATKVALQNMRIKGNVEQVRYHEEVEKVDGLVLPGGESTVVSTLASMQGEGGELFQTIKKRVSEGMPMMGICAGMILLSRRAYDRVVGETKQKLLGALDVVVERNAFGRQNESFEVNLEVPTLGKNRLKAIFIRAPVVTEIGTGVNILAELNGKIVAVMQKNIIGTSFHPELSDDYRIHKQFVSTVLNFKKNKPARQ